ncbi:signal peptide peptidase SppA [Metabacillus sp. GX 13764]|uniref:signal peptide peptidase SppA n=1 Tax=Metabacillus kandeliae TaxID=2900151 RepID=UPI001E2999C0|nr:signal peptide peptidase SppA [Metabacillus kandeliae]MCD7032760.1 signal peptide peptidase SppA [Metabacillus kandeliae]
MNGKRWIAIIIAIAVFGFSIALSFTTMLFTRTASLQQAFAGNKEFNEEVITPGNKSSKIAVLEVDGTIQDTGDASSVFQSSGYNHRQFLDMIKEAQDDSSVKGILLRVNSPGGGVVESAEIHKKLMDLKKKTKKPVYVSMETIAASGGYYISTAGDKIYAAPDTLTGSLGVIMQGINYGDLAKELGIKFDTVKSGPYKDIMSPNRDMTGAERKILQNMVNNAYKGFVGVISQGRHMSEADVRKIADGRIYDGRQAKDIGLVDELGYYDEAVEGLRKQIGTNAEVVRYKAGSGIGSLLSMSTQKFFGDDAKMFGLYQLFSKQNGSRLMYMYAE